jgi:uncharacterized membrane protein YeaQ/YmgE (transglycosylase-associated protein family)
MEVLAWIIMGALAGWIASIIMKTNEEMGALANIIVGIIGAFVGGFIVRMFGGEGASGLNFYSLLVAVLGAVLLLWIVKAFRGRGATLHR